MADPVAAAVAAPKKAFAFASNNLLAFLVLVALLMVAFVWYDSRKPGTLRLQVAKIPGGVGNYLTNQPRAA